MKSLIIAEKPSVAKDIAQVLGVPFNNGCYENQSLVISNCIGHLIELSVPEANQSGVSLPIIPKKFELSVKEQTKSQFEVLMKLLHRQDIDTVINACDAGREGELIFRLVYEKANCSKKMQRMWLQSMTDEAIKQAFEQRVSGNRYDALANAARSRAESDWLYGINGSRLMRSPVGRVMTPTLAMVVDRYLLNQQFKSIPFYKIKGTFKTEQGETYHGYLQQEDVTENPDRFTSKAHAEATKQSISLGQAKVNNERKIKNKLAPALYDLTTLQQEANKKFGFSASKTLELAQRLYEQHKVLSYPRTDARALPEDYVLKAEELVQALVNQSLYQSFAQEVLEQNWIKPTKTIFDNSKISDHFAIIPTGKCCDLPPDETKIFDLVVRRFLAVFYPPAVYEQITRLNEVNKFIFKSTGSKLVQAGWLVIYGNQDEDDGEKIEPLPPCETSVLVSTSIEEGKTKPPPLYTEATLLKAMETAGKQIEQDEYAQAIKDKGLGTPATRASIIEKLKNGQSGAYVTSQKNALIPTEKGIQLIKALRERYPSITSAELTGEWESRLKAVEKEQESRETYMRGIEQAVFDFVRAFDKMPIPASSHYPSIGKCPCCGKSDLVNRKFSHTCSNCGFNLSKEIAGLTLKEKDLQELISKGKTKKLKGFKSKAGKEFEAILKLNKVDKKVEFDFGK